MALNIRNGAELEQIFFLNTDAEAGIGFNQDFVELRNRSRYPP